MRTQKELLERICAADVEALAEYVEQQRAPLISIIRRKMSGGLQNKIEADDIFQEVCASAMQSLSEIDFQDRDPFLWLCHLIDRRVVDAHRRFHAKKRDVQQEVRMSAGGDDSQGGVVDMLIASITSPSMAFSRKRKENQLWQAMRSLPDDQQQALTMRFMQNMSSKEIAQELGKSDGAIRVMLTRATKKLEQLMTEAKDSDK